MILPPWKRKKPNPLSRKKKQGSIGGTWEFDFQGKHYSLPGKFVQDPESVSDDGLRWIATTASNKEIVTIVHHLAQGRCQMHLVEHCWRWMPRANAQTHHVIHKRMGNAFGDDRWFLIIGGEKVTNRILACPSCQREHHNKLHFGEFRESEQSA